MTVDTKGQLFDGTTIEGPDGLRDALLRHKDVVPAQLHAKPDDLCARPPRRSARHAGGAQDHSRRGEAQNYRMSAFVNGIVEVRRVPDGASCRAVAAQPDDDGSCPHQERQDRSCSLPDGIFRAARSLKGIGATVALPFLDAMVPAGALRAGPPAACA